MPGISYVRDYGDKLLNQIIMTGSHDAGITGGGNNTQTQKLDILAQASAGVRLFDIRIAPSGGSGSKLSTFHGPGASMFGKRRFVGGGFGLTLDKITADVLAFFQNNDDFLILKFDHSSKYDDIADHCRATLKGFLVDSGTVNLNMKKVKDLKKKALILFEDKAYKSLKNKDGILGIKNMKNGGGYDSKYPGLQYFGKGGTSVKNNVGFKEKLQENINNQTRLMDTNNDPEIMGMMYWTTTGVNKSIKERDKFNWSEDNQKLLFEFLNKRVPSSIDINKVSSSNVIKKFMPNFVMIDFAKEKRCDSIYKLNTASPIVVQQEMAHHGNEVSQKVQNLAAQASNQAGRIGQSALKKTGINLR